MGSFVFMKFNNLKSSNKNLAFILMVGAIIILAPIIFINIKKSGDVLSILQQIGIYNPPDWVVWAILGAAAVSSIISVLTLIGVATIPSWAAWALAGADTVGA